MTAFDDALRVAPDLAMAHTNKGIALVRLGELQAEMSNDTYSIDCLEKSLVEFSRSLEIAPNDGQVKALRDAVQERLYELNE